MKRWAFILLASVIGTQLLIIAAVITGCFIAYRADNKNPRCTGERASEMLTAALAQTFALYAAEK